MRYQKQNNRFRNFTELKSYLISVTLALWLFVDHSLAFNSLPRTYTARIQRSRCRSRVAMHMSQPGDGQKGSFGRIPAETIEEIKSYADIVTVIESYNLPFFSRSTDGSRATCVCPFHDDTNPSLNIDNSKGIYKCFSCGAGGDVFNFVREYDFISNREKKPKMSYPASIYKVATEFCGQDILKQLPAAGSGGGNKPLSPEKREKLEKQRKKKERIILANSAAADFYAKMLITSPSAGIARAHLLQRGIVPAMIRTFGIGFAPDAYFNKGAGKISGDSWGSGSLVEHLKEWNFSPAEILDAGLATVTSSARNRLQISGTIPGPSSEASIGKEMSGRNQAKSLNSERGGKKKETVGDDTLEYRDLIDRFRSRLMVPIFDESGKNVIGFGGRHLEPSGSEKEKDKSFKIAKYINSPETAVFIKKQTLFGIHAAQAAINTLSEDRMKEVASSNFFGSRAVPSIVVVEGYFDAITLFGAGIKEAVASMGTALTMTQLQKAANAIKGGGRIILCLDNDQAGITAAERVCTGSGMWNFLESTGVDISIASLPCGIKDPADFIEANGGIGNASSGELFRKKILDEAQAWDDWYISRLISKYNSDDRSSFSKVCEEVSNFLSTFPNAAERTKRAYDAAGKLADHISGEEGKSSNTPLKIQLESDLLSMASRKAAAKNALARRIEAVDGKENIKGTIAKLSSGEGSNPSQVKLETSSLNKPDSQTREGFTKRHPMNTTRKQLNQAGNRDRYNNGFRHDGRHNERQRAPPLTKHFSGFRFADNDATWLGINDKKSKKKIVMGETQEILGEKMKNHVYFNSNQYLGNEKSVLSRIAGASQSAPNIARSNNLIEPDADRILLDAEFRLLHTMIHCPSARLAMKSALSNRMDNGNALLQWSSLEREWLFQCLTDSPGHEPLPPELQEGGTVAQLKGNLRNRPDVPEAAFGISDMCTEDVVKKQGSKETSSFDNGTPFFIDIEVTPDKGGDNGLAPSPNEPRDIEHSDGLRFGSETSDSLEAASTPEIIMDNNGFPGSNKNEKSEQNIGLLDAFFEESEEITVLENIMKGPITDEERAELTVQETVAVMLKATAIKRLNHLKSEWRVANLVLKDKAESKSLTNDLDGIQNEGRHPSFATYVSMSDDELNDLCHSLGQKVVQAMDTARELTNSAQQLNERLLHYCIANDNAGRMSEIEKRELYKKMDEHLASLPDDDHRPDTAGDDDDYIFGGDEYDVNIDPRFGGRRLKDTDPKKSTSKASGNNRQSLLNYESIFE